MDRIRRRGGDELFHVCDIHFRSLHAPTPDGINEQIMQNRAKPAAHSLRILKRMRLTESAFNAVLHKVVRRIHAAGKGRRITSQSRQLHDQSIGETITRRHGGWSSRFGSGARIHPRLHNRPRAWGTPAKWHDAHWRW